MGNINGVISWTVVTETGEQWSSSERECSQTRLRTLTFPTRPAQAELVIEVGPRGQRGTQRVGDMEGGSQGVCLEGDREQSPHLCWQERPAGGGPRRPTDAGHAGPRRAWQERPWGDERAQDSPHWVLGGIVGLKDRSREG